MLAPLSSLILLILYGNSQMFRDYGNNFVSGVCGFTISGITPTEFEPYLKNPRCGDRPTQRSFSTSDCYSRRYDYQMFEKAEVIPDINCDRQFPERALMVQKLTIFTQLYKCFYKLLENALYADIQTCSKGKTTVLNYIDFSVTNKMTVVDASTTGVTYDMVDKMVLNYTDVTNLSASNLLMILDQTNFDTLWESYRKQLAVGGCCPESSPAHSIYDGTGIFKMTLGQGMYINIMKRNDFTIEKDSAGFPMLPVLNMDYFTMTIKDRYQGMHTVPDIMAKPLSDLSVVQLGNGHTLDEAISQDSIYYDRGVWLVTGGYFGAFKLHPEGQFFIKGKKSA